MTQERDKQKNNRRKRERVKLLSSASGARGCAARKEKKIPSRMFDNFFRHRIFEKTKTFEWNKAAKPKRTKMK